MRDHITGAVQFVSNNRLKFDGPAASIDALPDPAQTFGHVHKAVPQPPTKEVLDKLNTPEIKERCADLLSRYPVGQGALLEVLWLVQGVFGWVPTEVIRWAANVCGCAPAHALGVATFYTMYNHAPKGKFLLQFCRNISCTIKGAMPLIKYVENKLGIKSGETTPDGMFTILQVECLGSCGNGPMMLVNDDFATDVVDGQLKMKRGTTLTEASIDRIIDSCKAHSEGPRRPPRCSGCYGQAAGRRLRSAFSGAEREGRSRRDGCHPHMEGCSRIHEDRGGKEERQRLGRSGRAGREGQGVCGRCRQGRRRVPHDCHFRRTYGQAF